MRITRSRLAPWALLIIAIIGVTSLSSQTGRALIVRTLDQAPGWVSEQLRGISGPQSGSALTKVRPDRRPVALRDFNFNVVTVNSKGEVTDRHRGQAQYYEEELTADLKLDMVQIPSGTFMMGTSFAEAEQVAVEERRRTGSDIMLDRFANEYVAVQIPQHPVTVQGFFIGKFEVTQAQWRAVAQLPKVNKDLIADPSFFKGAERPVEEVTWEEAMEFCARLTKATGREYRLPSEAEWEYACRAGTKTQFHFGDTVTPDLVNYDGRYPYGLAAKGINREETVPVGSLGAANAFGLYDMHGNVEEWCLDPWHQNYNEAPLDGRVWITQGGSPWLGCGQDYRVVRGGSWLQGPASRSADRGPLWWTNNKNYFTGLRVVCATA